MRLIISAPFGNYHRLLKRVLRYEDFIPTLGTYTLRPRGLWDPPYGGRWMRAFLTLRYSYFLKSWINKIGLKNPGIQNIKENVSDKIISVHGFTDIEWIALAEIVKTMSPLAMELNMSCPNVSEYYPTAHLFATIIHYVKPVEVIVKLPPVGYRQMAFNAYLGGVRKFHACNTIPTKCGGISGKALLPISLEVVNHLYRVYKEEGIKIIGGGGITCKDDVEMYKKMGADDIAIGTMLLNPFNWKDVKDLVME